MSKRLLLISSNSSGRGGGERYLTYLTQGLHLLNCEVHVLLSTVDYMDDWAKALSAEGATVHRRNLLGLRHRRLRFVQSITDKQQQLEIASVCRDVAPDAVLVNQQYDEDGLDYLAGALIADVAPVAGIMHMPMTATKHKRPLGSLRGKALSTWYKKHPYALILVSEGSQKEFEHYYPRPRPTQVVHYGCPFPSSSISSQFCKASLDLPRDWPTTPIIGFIGQLVPQKNLDLLIDAWVWLRFQGVAARLLLVGDGSERTNLQHKLAQAASANEWYITGWQSTPEHYFSCIDVYAMTSQFEGLPLALIEAVGNGIPTVTTNFNGASDVAKRAPWSTVAPEQTPKVVGSALVKSLQENERLKQQAKDGKQEFQAYFSIKRMAAETLAVLGIYEGT